MSKIFSALLAQPYVALPLTIAIYLAGIWFQKKIRTNLIHPLLITIAAIILIIYVTGSDYDDYKKGSFIIDFMLGPSVVALGYTLYRQIEHLRKNAVSILASLFAGSLIGVLSVRLITELMGAGPDLISTLQPKSVTTPIAMVIAQNNGGIPELTAVVVVATGVLGGIIGPPLLALFRIKSPVARGLAMGAAGHGVGTSVAIQMGAIEGALGGLAIGIMGAFTAFIVPVVDKVMTLF